MRFLIPLFFSLLFISLFSSGATAKTAEKEPLTFRVRLTEDLGTLDWNYGEVNPDIVYQLMEGLFRTDDQGKPVVAAAASYRWNEAKTEMVVQLKRDRRWSDGSPVCAQQFVDSWARLQSKKFASPYAHYANGLKSFEAKSCRELRIRFERPSPEAPAFLSHYVFFPLRAEQLRQSKLFNEGVGLHVNGPFRVRSWQSNQSLTLERNPEFTGQAPALERIEFLFVPEESTAQVMYEQKRIDWLKDVPALMRGKATEKQLRVFPSLTSFYFGLNASKSDLLKDANVRAALSEALDRTEFPKILGREYRGTHTWVSPVVLPGVKTVRPTVNWGEAKRKLKEAEKAGAMSLSLKVYAKAAHKTLAEWAQGQWEKKLGVRIPIEVQEGKAYWRDIYVNPAPIFLGGVTAPYGHPRAYLQEFLSSSTANWTGWSSAAYDTAVDEEKFQVAEDILREGGMIIPLYTRESVALVAAKWKGFHVNPLGQVFLEKVKP